MKRSDCFCLLGLNLTTDNENINLYIIRKKERKGTDLFVYLAWDSLQEIYRPIVRDHHN